MTTNEYIGYLGAAAVVVPFGALIANFVALKIAHFQARYTMVLISSLIAFIAASAVGILIHQSSLRLLVAMIILACCHTFFLRSRADDRLTPGKALFVAFCQMVGAVICLFAVLFLLAGLKRLFT